MITGSFPDILEPVVTDSAGGMWGLPDVTDPESMRDMIEWLDCKASAVMMFRNGK